MMDTLRDPLWQFAISLAALLVTLWTLRYQLRRKSLSYSVYRYSLISYHSEDFKRQVKVLYGDYEVKNFTAWVIEFVNDGFVEIKASDFDRPLSVLLEGSCNLIGVNIAVASPEDLPVKLNESENEIWIQPLLLNRRDWFRLNLLVDEQEELVSPKVTARIQGISEIKCKPPSLPFFQRRYFWLYSLGMTILVIFAFILAGWMYEAGRKFAGCACEQATDVKHAADPQRIEGKKK